MFGMPTQECHRDQRKIEQVIDQIKVLGNNLDELRDEIVALRVSYLNKGKESSHENDLKQCKNSKTNILQKVKKYARKVSIRSFKTEPQVNDNPQASCLDASLPVFLNYMFGMGKKGVFWQMPNKIKSFRRKVNHTDEELQRTRFIANNNLLQSYPDSSLDHKRQTKTIATKTESLSAGKNSEISCDLDVQVDHPTLSTLTTKTTISPNSCVIKNCSKNAKGCSANDEGKESLTKSTQTNKFNKIQRRINNLNSHAKHPNFCFSKIKKAARSANISNRAVFKRINSTNQQKYLKGEFCKNCTCRKNDLVDSRGQKVGVQNYSDNKDISNLKKKEHMDNKKSSEINSIKELPCSSSSADSVCLEVNISNDSVKKEEFSNEFLERRRPRTYLIRKKNVNHNQDNRIQYEKSVLYVGQTSDLSLSSTSFSDKNIVNN